jgi:hypothetical protein
MGKIRERSVGWTAGNSPVESDSAGGGERRKDGDRARMRRRTRMKTCGRTDTITSTTEKPRKERMSWQLGVGMSMEKIAAGWR